MSDINIEISTQTIKCEITGITGTTSLPTPSENNSVIVSFGESWIAKTIAQFKDILGLGTAAYTASTDYATAAHLHTGVYAPVDSDFQSVAFANPLVCDATTYKDFKATITGDTVINLTNTSPGNAGMLRLLIDTTGGYTVTPGTMFTEKLGDTSISTTADTINYISYRNDGIGIVYTINQPEA